MVYADNRSKFAIAILANGLAIAVQITCNANGLATVRGLWDFTCPRTFVKTYYSHMNFAVVTFLTKIQNWRYKTNKELVKKIWMVKTTAVQKIWMGKNTSIQEFWLTIQKVGSSRISFSLFLLIRFWILVRNVFDKNHRVHCFLPVAM